MVLISLLLWKLLDLQVVVPSPTLIKLARSWLLTTLGGQIDDRFAFPGKQKDHHGG